LLPFLRRGGKKINPIQVESIIPKKLPQSIFSSFWPHVCEALPPQKKNMKNIA
jgi:hypothetical protein